MYRKSDCTIHNHQRYLDTGDSIVYFISKESSDFCQTNFWQKLEKALFPKRERKYLKNSSLSEVSYNSKSNELISVTQFFPAGGDEREKTWVELMVIYRILMDRMSRPVEDLLLQCENTYLRSYNKNHGIPVIKIRAKSEPGDPLLNPLLSIGHQIETTTHSFQIPISRLVTKITGDKNLDIRAQSIGEVDMTSNLAKNLGKMIDKWLQIQEKIHPEDLQQNVLKENIVEQFKTIQEDKERILAGGILLMFFETNDPVPAGFCLSFRSKNEISILQFLIVGPQRNKRVKSALQAFIQYFRFDDGRDIKLILKTSACDTEMTRTLESLGFSLARVVYDLTKDGPDRDKVVFDTYASQILGV